MQMPFISKTVVDSFVMFIAFIKCLLRVSNLILFLSIQQPTDVSDLPLAVMFFQDACFITQARHIHCFLACIGTILLESNPGHVAGYSNVEIFPSYILTVLFGIFFNDLSHSLTNYRPSLSNGNTSMFPPSNNANVFILYPTIREALKILIPKCFCFCDNYFLNSFFFSSHCVGAARVFQSYRWTN